ncbi:flavodoxin family protein [Dialister sp.]|uniref:flavodoxin family protein n=1 Tax=Dialister sp. TaxID=1955814 RepID=UPI003F04DC8B
MKSLVLWSSRTGNTKAVAQAVYDALPGEKDMVEEGREKDISGYDLIFVGFWGFRRGADMAARRTLEKLHGQKVAVFGTAGTYPDSQAARDYLANAAALLPEDSTCLGTFICQGRVHSFHIGKRSAHAEKVHPMTPERLKRLEEAEKHPNEEDFKNAAAWALEMAEKAQEV